jgi:hypothetical protein
LAHPAKAGWYFGGFSFFFLISAEFLIYLQSSPTLENWVVSGALLPYQRSEVLGNFSLADVGKAAIVVNTMTLHYRSLGWIDIPQIQNSLVNHHNGNGSTTKKWMV